MCRLFGFNSGKDAIHAAYWLLEAPDSMLDQGERNPDGTGIGWFSADGTARMDKQPLATDTDPSFVREAKRVDTAQLVSHVRMTLLPKGSDSALGKDHLLVDTHPFLIDDRLMAHNGGFGDLEKLDEHLGPYLAQVKGHTDSERFAALIAKESAASGDVVEGISTAATWISQNLPMYSLNTIVIAEGNLYALRYPDQRSLHVARRTVTPGDDWRGRSSLAEHRLRAEGTDDVSPCRRLGLARAVGAAWQVGPPPPPVM